AEGVSNFGFQVMVDGTFSGNTIKGSYSTTQNPCTPVGDQGSITFTLVPQVTGTWSGTGISNQGLGMFTFTDKVTENVQNGNLANTMNFTSSPCFTTLTPVGYQAGNTVTITDPSGALSAAGSLNGSGNQVQGTYKTNATCNFDQGTFTMNKQ